MNWTRFIEQRSQRIEAARNSAAALLDGRVALAHEQLGAWSLTQRADWDRGVLSELRHRPPQPADAERSQALGSANDMAPPGPDVQTPDAMQAWLADRPLSPVPASARDDLAWGLLTLSELGHDLHHRQRPAWNAQTFQSDPERDAETAALWLRWFDNDTESIRAPWERLFLSPSRRALYAILRGRGVPSARWSTIVEDHDDAFFFRMYGADGGTPGYKEVATRVIEESAVPLRSLTDVLSSEGWNRVGWCSTHKSNHRATLRRLVTEFEHSPALGRHVATSGRSDPGWLDAMLAAHLAFRLIDAWASGKNTDAAGTRRIVKANLGRSQARLRALASEEPLRDRIAALPALHARTTKAILRYGRDWASREFKHDFTYSGGSVDAPCIRLAPTRAPFGPEEREMLRTWVLRAVLLNPDHVEALERWPRTGGIGRKSSTWSRLLNDLPETLQDPPEPGQVHRRRSWVQAELIEELDALYAELLPTLQELGAIDPSARDYKRRFEAIVGPLWRAEVPSMNVRIKTYIANAALAARKLAAREMS